MKLVIGLSGKMGSGKTEISTYLSERYGAKQMRFSKILMDILERLHVPSTRSNLQKLGHGLRTCMGEDVLVKAFEGDIAEIGSGIAVIDGVRYPNEVEMINGFENSMVLYVDASQQLRYERCVKRGEKGEASMSFEQFCENEGKETERHIDEVKGLSDYIILNELSKEGLFSRIDALLQEKTN